MPEDSDIPVEKCAIHMTSGWGCGLSQTLSGFPVMVVIVEFQNTSDIY